MNILFITNLTGDMWTGPNNSVPARIKAQSKIDNVFWYNLNSNRQEKWEKTKVFFNIEDYPNKSILDLPQPFSSPDLVIFEGVYEYPFSKIGWEVQKHRIPYVLVPRSQLTIRAQKNKAIKKRVGNILYFNRFIKKAVAIHYLTNKEFTDSGKKWNLNHFIVPNGIDKKEILHQTKTLTFLKGIYIGRIDIYQKGLDLLIEAVYKIKNDMLANNCTIDLYGPDSSNSKEKLLKMINNYGLQDIIKIKDAVFGQEKEVLQQHADFFIMTSRFEGHPMGLIEALSYGLPSIITNGTNMSSEITDFDAGWTTLDDDLTNISNTLLKLLKEKNKIHTKSYYARKLSYEYNWDKLAKLSKKKFKEILNNKGDFL